jgi:hypothetical protein
MLAEREGFDAKGHFAIGLMNWICSAATGKYPAIPIVHDLRLPFP